MAAKLGKLGIAERFRISREHIARTQDGLFGAFFRRRPEGNEDEDDQGRHDWAKVAKHYGTFWHLFLTLATSVPSPRRAFELSVESGLGEGGSAMYSSAKEYRIAFLYVSAIMIGRSLSHYKILEKLGSGGMGDVYLAEDEKLRRKVALKVIARGLADDAGTAEAFRARGTGGGRAQPSQHRDPLFG